MSIGIRAMRVGEEDAIAAMVRQLPRELGRDASSPLTGETLRAGRDVLRVTVADNAGLLLGACIWMQTFSTWRGSKGIHISDLFVMAHARGRKIGERLLRGVAREGKALGANYVRLELGVDNSASAGFYEHLGFAVDDSSRLLFLEQDGLEQLVKGLTA